MKLCFASLARLTEAERRGKRTVLRQDEQASRKSTARFSCHKTTKTHPSQLYKLCPKTNTTRGNPTTGLEGQVILPCEATGDGGGEGRGSKSVTLETEPTEPSDPKHWNLHQS